jgi:hypothetical protein
MQGGLPNKKNSEAHHLGIFFISLLSAAAACSTAATAEAIAAFTTARTRGRRGYLLQQIIPER